MQNGPFDSLGQLIEVKGIGPKSLEKMRPFLFVRDSVDLKNKDSPNTDSPKPDSIETSS
tara:strand:- start:899 stop:1075 length:177 start_codon:yes stop_codon:yes gene_type:complete